MPVVYQLDIKGGYHQVTDLLNNDIPVNLKKIGMIAWDETTQFSYQWNGSVWNKVFVVRNWGIDLTFYKGQLFLKNNKLFKAEKDGVILAAIEPDTNSDWTRIGVEVEDVLTSNSIINALSANQGRTLNEAIIAYQAKLDALPIGTSEGQMQYWDGTAWVLLDPSETDATTLKMISDVPVWVSPPGAPVIGSVVGGNARAQVAYAAPADNGGSAITSYTAISSPDGLTGTVVQPGDGIICVLGLTNGTPYTFTLKASNAVGMSVASDPSASVTPATVPDAPAISSVTVSNKQASVVYTAPANNGGALITSYTATSSPDGFTGTVNQTDGGTILVNGLVDGTVYTFTLTASNAVGTGAASLASVSVKTSNVPDAPEITMVTADNEQVIIDYTAPANNGGSTIVTYTATSYPGGFTATVVQAESGTITVFGLTNGTPYTFTLKACNAAGMSAASLASNSVIPENMVPHVVSATGRTWMDRNLGASQVATSPTDVLAYGDLYQWGRSADGHQLRNSGTTTTQSHSTVPGHANFIKNSYCWCSQLDTASWKPPLVINNPCPPGFRLPLNTEWNAEIDTWEHKGVTGAFNSVLKLPAGGNRNPMGTTAGHLHDVGTYGYYWCCQSRWSVDWGHWTCLGIRYDPSSYNHVGWSSPAGARAIRCIKD